MHLGVKCLEPTTLMSRTYDSDARTWERNLVLPKTSLVRKPPGIKPLGVERPLVGLEWKISRGILLRDRETSSLDNDSNTLSRQKIHKMIEIYAS
ncbi:hypothetical protein AVEN_171008-1 [Araneus ventricosus]|uniref:Uncharacterized protein n=1 Tax=Araneus ventricosus TaxID=182803 RepID=A0A4Y2JB38_ARAVE|nr:hypothetical protein AVEN_127208-1 [Araneus ventricosus]GBM87270.1 hypothetical protein AVEN_171008-1 [Araneus ventricosus]